MLSVQLLAHTPEPDRLVAAAYKICYSPSGAGQLLDGLTPEKTADFLEHVSAFGHESPVEHASFTFAVEGVSRSLMAQMTRHRIASFSVQSQRYVKKNCFTYVIPPGIESNPEALELFVGAMEQTQAAYDALQAQLTEVYQARLMAEGCDAKQARAQAVKLANEDARFVLPNACETKLMATFNVRSLYNFFRLRCCNRAQWEIRELAWQMLALCREKAPLLFGSAGPSCLSGPCKEGKMSCGNTKSVQERSRTLLSKVE